MRGKQKYGMTISAARRAREKEEEEKKKNRIGTTGSVRKRVRTADQVQKASRDKASSKAGGRRLGADDPARGRQGIGRSGRAAAQAAQATTAKASPTPKREKTSMQRKGDTVTASTISNAKANQRRAAARSFKRSAAAKKTTTPKAPSGGRKRAQQLTAAARTAAAGGVKGGVSVKKDAEKKPAAKELSFKKKFAAARAARIDSGKKGAGGVFTWKNNKYTTNYEAEQAAIDKAKARKDKKDALSGSSAARSLASRTRSPSTGYHRR